MGEQGIWDVTVAASSHASLSGVLAGLAIAILAIPVVRRQIGGRASGLKLPILSVLLLIVSAVTWGGLSGQPGREQLSNLGKETAGLLYAQNMMIGASAVLFLSIGALTLVNPIVEFVADNADDIRAFAAALYGVLGGLALYECVLFALDPVAAVFKNEPLHASGNIEWWIALGCGSTAVALSLLSVHIRGVQRMLDGLEVGLGRISRQAPEDVPVLLAGTVGLLAVVSYALSPPHMAQPASDFSGFDIACVLLNLAACVALLVFVAVASHGLSDARQLSLEVGKSQIRYSDGSAEPDGADGSVAEGAQEADVTSDEWS